MNSGETKTKITFDQFEEDMRLSFRLSYENSIFEFPLSFIFVQNKSVQHEFTFKKCHFTKIEFQNAIFTSKIHFQSCIIENDFTINNCNFNHFFKAYHISAKNITFWDNNFVQGFELYNFENVENLILQFKKVTKKIFIQQWHVNPVELNNIQITFENITDSPILIGNLFSKKIEIQLSGQLLNDSLWIGDIKAKELRLINIKNKSTNKIELVRIEAWKIYFLWLHNDGWLRIESLLRYSAKESSLIDIQNSYFGNAELYNVDLSSFERVIISNCHLQNIIPVNVKWNFNIDAFKDVKPEYLRELFRQLKNVCSKNMDKISQLQFEKLEMLFYSSQLHWRNNFQDWFILKTNQISNNHGLSWTRPLFWLLGCSLIFYTIVNYVSGNFGCYHIGNYLNFIQPLHNINDLLCLKVSESTHRNWVYFWDMTQRLVSSYLIFQFLRSFRKFVN